MSESSTVGSRRVGRELIVLPTGDRWLEQNLLSLEHSDHPRCGADLRGAPRANAIGGPPPSSIPGHPQQHGVHRHHGRSHGFGTSTAGSTTASPPSAPPSAPAPGVKHRHYSVGRGFESVTHHRLGQGDQCEHARIERSRGLSSALHPGLRSPQRRSNQSPPGGGHLGVRLSELDYGPT